MPTLLENCSTVNLWAGWSVALPPSHYQRNDDGSWSAWGADWTIDVTIIEVGGGPDGKPASPAQLLNGEGLISLSGNGWLGTAKVLREVDANREIFCLAAKLAATNTLLLFWVSYFREQQYEFAQGLVRGVANSFPNAV